MKSAAALLASLLFCAVASAQDLATCTSPTGHAYYPNKGLVKKKDSGWSVDKISGGIVTLKKLSAKEFDILWVDTTKSIHSAVQDGGLVRLLRTGESDMTFLVFYPGQTIELYTFMQETVMCPH